MYFWAIANAGDRVGAFLSWLEGLPVAMVNQLGTTPPTDPEDVPVIAALDARLTRWVAAAPAHREEQAHLDLRIAAGDWLPQATAVIRRAALVFLALEPRERNSHVLQIVLAPFDTLGPVGAALD